jgi:hypothetical protein
MTDLRTPPTADLQERAADVLRGIVEKYAAGEAEVVRAYFAQPHSNEDHIEVLLKQMGREIQGRGGLGPTMASMTADLERGVDRHHYAEHLRPSAEEAHHYVLLADIVDWLAGRKLEADRLLGYEVFGVFDPTLSESAMYNPRLPEAGRNLDVGREIIAALGRERARELTHLAEGGGGGAFVECSRLHGDEFRDRLAAAMRIITEDELGHGPGRIDGYAREWVHSDAEIEEDARWLDAFMLAHLRVRNEIWGYPLDEDRIAAIQTAAAARDL